MIDKQEDKFVKYYAVEIEYRVVTKRIVQANSEDEAIKDSEESGTLKPEFIVRKEAKAVE